MRSSVIAVDRHMGRHERVKGKDRHESVYSAPGLLMLQQGKKTSVTKEVRYESVRDGTAASTTLVCAGKEAFKRRG